MHYSFFYPNPAQQHQKKPENEGSFFAANDMRKVNNNDSSFFQPNSHSTGFFPTVQTKVQPSNGLSIGKPGDKYEVEADSMADKVVQRLANSNVQPDMLQRKCFNCEEEEKQVQKKEQPLIPKISDIQSKPTVNSESVSEESIQRKCDKCEAKEKEVHKKEQLFGLNKSEIQRKPIFESEPTNDELVQRKCAECENEEKQLQKKEQNLKADPASNESNSEKLHLSSSDSALQHKCAACEKEDEQLQKKEKPHQNDTIIQKQSILESNQPIGDDELTELNEAIVQMKCEKCGEKELLQKKDVHPIPNNINTQLKPIFESDDGKDETVQFKCDDCQQEEERSAKEQEENDFNNPKIMAKQSAGQPITNQSISDQLSGRKGRGTQLPRDIRMGMESAFGTDFKQVNIHTDSQSVQMNNNLNAQAFTHGNDIYFNQGKFDAESSSGRHLLAHELTHVIQQNQNQHQNIQRRVCDNIPENENQFYGHGGFMGAAPLLMADDKWNRILQALMPDVHAAATDKLSGGPKSEDLILMFENNPVMAAYGMFKTQQMDVRRDNGRDDRIEKMKAIEWDVFLPTSIVEAYKKTEDEDERVRLAGLLVKDMIIAHGTTGQTAKENFPGGGARQYENVKGTAKTDQGGVRPRAWMDLFGRALMLARDENWEEKAREYEDPDLHPRVDSPRDQAAHQTFQNQLSFKTVVNLYKEIFNKETFSVLLDVKSRDASPLILRALVEELNRQHIHVYGIGSFKFHELEGLSDMTQTVDGKTFEGPTEVKFFHLAGDLQKACLEDKISNGDTVMFNGGSLISYDRWARGPQKKASYEINQIIVDQLRVYKERYGFHLGLYVQENDIDDRAATLITEMVNNNSHIFDLGFAWGGLSGRAASDIEPSLRNATVGIFKQRSIFIGSKDWDVNLPAPGFHSTFSINHQLNSRPFSVSRERANVESEANWNNNTCTPNSYKITLIQRIPHWYGDDHVELESKTFPVGHPRTGLWETLDSGQYYLKIHFDSDVDDDCKLDGTIDVTT